MNENPVPIAQEPQKESSSTTPPPPLRVVLLADEKSLLSYGPVLRRLAVGLLDEVSDLSLLALGTCKLLRHVPSPPVRLITETRQYRQSPLKFDISARQTTITAPPFGLVDKLMPQRRAARIAEILGRYKPLLLHALSERQFRLARDLSSLLGISYIVSLLAIEPPKRIFSDPNCGGFLCCYSGQARRIRTGRIFPADRVHLLPIGTHVTPEPCCFRHLQPVSNIFCCSPLEDKCGLTGLINVVKKLINKGRQIRLVLAGEGPAEHTLRRQAARLNLLAEIHFIPPVEKIVSASDAYKALFREADIYVQPWRAKQWRPELLEAMSVGNAVIVAENRDNDLVINGKTAAVVPFDDADALAQVLDRMLQDRNYALALAQNAQQHLRKHFLASRMIARLAHTYRQVLNADNDK